MKVRSARGRSPFVPNKVRPFDPGEADGYEVSVVIPVDSPEYATHAAECLKSIRGQQHLPRESVEIVLSCVQKAEHDLGGYRELCAAYGAVLAVETRHYEHYPLAFARNFGVHHASKPVVAFMDADIVLDPELLARAGCHPEALVTSWFCYLGENYNRRMVTSGDLKRFRDEAHRHRVHNAAYGGGIIVPRKTFEEIGGFDEEYDIAWGAEDNDFVDRAVEHGLEWVNLSSSSAGGIINAHLWHPPRGGGADPNTAVNRQRYWNLNTVVRNPNGWGVASQPEEEEPISRPLESVATTLVHPTVRVIICASSDVYADRLQRCLLALRNSIRLDWNSIEIVISAVRHEDTPVDRIRRIAERFGARVHGGHHEEPAYNLSRARNAGARGAKAQVLCFLDADAILGPDAMIEALSELTESRFVISRAVHGKPEDGESIYRTTTAKAFSDTIWNRERMEFGGFVLVPRRHYEHLGGYDEEYVGWGAEDNDFYERLQKIGVEQVDISEERGVLVLHQWHPSREDPEEEFREENRRRLARRDLPVCRNAPRGGITTAVLYHPLRPLDCLVRSLRALEKAVEGREHVVDLFVQGQVASLPSPGDFEFDLNITVYDKNRGIPLPCRKSVLRCIDRGHTWWSKVDDDIILPPGAFDTLIGVMEREDALGEYSIGAVQMSTGPGTHAHTPKLFAMGERLTLPVGSYAERTEGEVSWSVCDCVGAGGAVYRASIFDSCELDTSLTVGCDDTDLCLQMAHRGIRSALVTSPCSDHLVRECYNPDYKAVRYDRKLIDHCAALFLEKWGMEFKV